MLSDNGFVFEATTVEKIAIMAREILLTMQELLQKEDDVRLKERDDAAEKARLNTQIHLHK